MPFIGWFCTTGFVEETGWNFAFLLIFCNARCAPFVMVGWVTRTAGVGAGAETY
jgi:hypothetical protein